jgi:predicted dehydrogenase
MTTPSEPVALERTNVYVPQVDDVSDAIRWGTLPRSDGRQGLAVLEVLDAALRSAEERRAIEVTPARRDPGATRS